MHCKITYIIIMIFHIVFSLQAADNKLNKTEDIIAGKKYSIQSSVLDEEREVLISLPENYNHSSHHYPVIYVMDAEFLFGLTRSIVDIRATRHYMPESIIVGLTNNTGKRVDMALKIYNDNGVAFFGNAGGKTGTYLKFLRNELIPVIEKQFRVNSHRTIIGMSPTFGPVLEAFWSESDLFDGYIVLAAELGKKLQSGQTIGDKLVKAISDKKHPSAAIYIGTGSRDIKSRGPKEAAAYIDIPAELKDKANKNINYKFEIIYDEDHYGMSIPGIQHGLETIHPRNIWDIDYRDFRDNSKPAQALEAKYKQLSDHYGFKIIPIEKSFYFNHNILGTARRFTNQGKTKELLSWLKLAINYYPYSPEIHYQLSKAYTLIGEKQLALSSAEKAAKLASEQENTEFHTKN